MYNNNEKECKNCKYFEPGIDNSHKGFCIKTPKRITSISEWCGGFEYKTQFISVDISRVKDNERFKSIYSANTNSDIIVSTSIENIYTVLGIKVSEPYIKQIKDQIDKIQTTPIKEGDQTGSGRFNLGDITIELHKSWIY
jgi:hypothetical protein